MSRPIRYALVGPGEVADRFLVPAIRRLPDTHFAGVLGRDPQRTAAFAQKHGAGRVYRSLDDLADDPSIDLVLIASPDNQHAPQALRLLAAGKHLFVEKPMATTRADAEAIVQRAEVAGLVLAVGYHLRFHAGHRKLAAMLHGGELGTVRHLYLHWAYPIPAGNWRNQDAGGWWSLAALGTHCLDLVSYFTGVPLDAIAASCVPVTCATTGKDESALVSLVLPGGATAQVCSSAAYRSRPVVRIATDKGVIECDWTLGPRGQGAIRFNEQPIEFTPVDPYLGELSEVVAAIREGRRPEADGRVGLANVALLERLMVKS